MIFKFSDINNCKLRIEKRLNLIENDILLLLTIFTNNIMLDSYLNLIIDSQLTSIIYNIYIKNEYNNKNNNKKILYFKEYFNNEIVTIPICFNYHWSIIIYIKELKLLFHIDSILNYHLKYFYKFIEIINCNLNIELNEIIILNSIKQKGTWECGYYLILFFYLFIKNYNNDNKNFLNQFKIDLLKEYDINLFINCLNQLLDLNFKIQKVSKCKTSPSTPSVIID